jgi:hypothetical protein
MLVTSKQFSIFITPSSLLHFLCTGKPIDLYLYKETILYTILVYRLALFVAFIPSFMLI